MMLLTSAFKITAVFEKDKTINTLEYFIDYMYYYVSPDSVFRRESVAPSGDWNYL
jgi:hypothetical protein